MHTSVHAHVQWVAPERPFLLSLFHGQNSLLFQLTWINYFVKQAPLSPSKRERSGNWTSPGLLKSVIKGQPKSEILL